MKVFYRTIGAALCLTTVVPVFAAEDCEFEAERSAVVGAAGADQLEVLARAGSLRVVGTAGLTEVRVMGRACASHEALLDEIRLAAERRGGNVTVEALMPEQSFGFRRRYARLDLTIEAPAGIAADIEDSSGEAEVRGLGPLVLDDSSGGITVTDIAGPARIRDSSGGLRVEDVAGSVTIDDSSGSTLVARVDGDVAIDDSSGGIVVRDVTGAVEIDDSSGSIDVTEAAGSVTIMSDSSGSISVHDVGGDFVVRHDSSGGVTYGDVRGSVRIPSP